MHANTELFPQAAAGSPAPQPADWGRMLWRQRWLLAGCTLSVGLLALGFVSTQAPVYATTAKVWVQTEQQGSPSFLSGIAAYRESPIPDPVNRKIETEMELMRTRSSAQDVIRRLGIQETQLARAPMDQLMARLRSWLPGAGLKEGEPAPQLEELFLKGLSVTPQRSGTADTTSNVLELRFECADAALAPRALQALLENYLRMGEQQNRSLGEATSRLVEAKMSQARQELAGIEDEMLKLALREQGREAMQGISPAPRSSVPGGALRFDLGPELSGSAHAQAMAQLKGQTLELQAQLAAARQLYTEDAEQVRTLRQRLAEATGRLRAGVAAGARADAEMSRLERARGMAQERYVELRRKLDQIELYLQLNPSDAASRTVIDAPLQPRTPERSRRSLMLALGLFGGLMLGLLLGGLREWLDRRLHGAAEVQRLLGLPVLGSLPAWTPAQRQQLDAAL